MLSRQIEAEIGAQTFVDLFFDLRSRILKPYPSQYVESGPRTLSDVIRGRSTALVSQVIGNNNYEGRVCMGRRGLEVYRLTITDPALPLPLAEVMVDFRKGVDAVLRVPVLFKEDIYSSCLFSPGTNLLLDNDIDSSALSLIEKTATIPDGYLSLYGRAEIGLSLKNASKSPSLKIRLNDSVWYAEREFTVSLVEGWLLSSGINIGFQGSDGSAYIIPGNAYVSPAQLLAVFREITGLIPEVSPQKSPRGSLRLVK